MNSKRKLFSGAARVGIAATLVGGLPIAASGQETNEQSPVRIEEIVVTADKRSGKSVQDLASSITAFDASKLERLDVVDFDDFIVQVPGANFLNDGGPGRDNEVASIRGLSAVADNTVGVVAQYLDGAPHFGNTYRLFDIGEAAVLRGPQGTLWGSQSIGGLIYYRSNRPDPSGFYGEALADVYSSSGDGGASYRTLGVLNAPLAEDVFAMRLAVQYIDETGYIDNLRTGADAINNVRETAWRLSALWNVSDAVTVTGIYHGDDLEADAPTYFEIDLDGQQIDRPRDWHPTTQEYDLFNLLIDADLGWATLSYTGSWFDNDGGYWDFDDDLGPVQRFETTIDEDATTHELRLSSSGSGQLQYLVGIYMDDYDRFNQSVDFTLGGGAPAEGVRQGGPINYQESAFFTEISYDLTEKLRVLVGGRYFDWEVQDDTVFLIGGADFGFVTNGVASDEEFFYKLLAEYRFNDAVMTYVSRSEGFRYGGFNTFVGEALFGIPEQYFQFDPDTLVSYEVGVKSSFADDRVLLNAALYFLDWEKVQAVVQSDMAGAFGQGFFTTNAPDLEAQGFEIELATQDLVAPGFYAALSWAYTDNEFQDDAQLFPGTRVTINKGDSLRRTPRNTYSADIGYEFTIGATMEAYVRANYWHKDSTSSFGYNGNDGDVQVPAQNFGNFSAGVRWDSFQLKLYVDNFTDAVPWLNVFPAGAAGQPGGDDAVRANTLRPRTVGLQGTYYFGAR